VVNTMNAADTMTVIRVTDVPEVISPATSDQNALRTAINDAQPSKARADWSGALTLAIAGAASIIDFNVVIISDGNLGDPALLPNVPGEVRYIPVGSSGQNVAISALATDTLSGQTPQLFTQLSNYGDTETEVLFSLSVDGTLFASDFLTIPAGDDLAFVSEELPADFRLISASVSIPSSSPAPDYLALDNEAWAVASGTGTNWSVGCRHSHLTCIFLMVGCQIHCLMAICLLSTHRAPYHFLQLAQKSGAPVKSVQHRQTRV
jgi:Ca-activated chloride channel homolog